MATTKNGGSGTANLPPDVKARMDKLAGLNGQIGTAGGGPPMIGPPSTLNGDPRFVGPPEQYQTQPGFGGIPPSFGGGPTSDVMRILLGGSTPNLGGQRMPFQIGGYGGFPSFSNLLLGMGGRNG